MVIGGSLGCDLLSSSLVLVKSHFLKCCFITCTFETRPPLDCSGVLLSGSVPRMRLKKLIGLGDGICIF